MTIDKKIKDGKQQYNINICYRQKNIKKSYKSNDFKVSAPTWSDKFEISDGSYSISDIQDHFEYIIKNYRTLIILN